MVTGQMANDDLPPTLDQCSECGKVMASTNGHNCDAQYDSQSLDRSEREAISELDERIPEADVVVWRSGQRYHETTSANDAVCRPDADKDDATVVTRREAKDRRGYSPCISCLKGTRRWIDNLKSEPGGHACLTCLPDRCHTCHRDGQQPYPPIERRSEYGGHFLCERCYRDLVTTERLIEEVL